MSGKLIRIFTVLAILILPCVFYLFLLTGKNHYKQLEIFGPKDVTVKGDTLYHTIPPFAFYNQEGKKFSDKDLNGIIFVTNFFFATCPSVCPKMNENVKGIAEHFKKDTTVKFISFTVNPAHDSVPVLASYAKERNADPHQWSFLTGSKDSIYSLAQIGFLETAAEGKTANDFFHSQNLILIDKEKRIRGIYDGLEDADIKKLRDEILVLEMEYKDK